jgi:cell division protein FtsW (lipid II flippase)
MALIQRVSYSEVPWGWLLLTFLLTAMGVSFVISACYDPGAPYGLGDEARKQLGWWVVSVVACITTMHVPFATWRGLAVPLFLAGLCLEVFMLVAAGTSVVPVIKGQANWLVLGPLRLQPVEFIKLATLLACARLVSHPDFQPARLLHLIAALSLAAVPSLLHARSDLGSSLTFPPMIFGMLLAMGMRLSHFVIIALTCVVVAVGSLTVLTMEAEEGSSVRQVQEALLPRTGAKSYQYKRIMAWLNPDDYALTEGYQTARSVRSIGSGQFLGKGYLDGDQNRLGWLPEKHTDLIFAVVGEEVGFVGSVLVLALLLAFAWVGLHAAAMCRDPCGRAVIVGYVCLIIGQSSINLAVAMGMMPVTGITLPFFSYGGSSLLACHLGLGICLSAALAPRREQTRMSMG